MEHDGASPGVSRSPLLDATGVDVAIVNYNTRDSLDRCLASLEHEPVGRVIVVDNASNDGSAAVVERRGPRVNLIANRKNVGYGAAANQSFQAAASKYVLLLNADTEVRSGAVRQLAAYLDEHPQVAIAAPRLEDAHGAVQYSCFPFPGTVGWLFEHGPLSLWTRHVNFARRRSISFRAGLEPRPVPWALGAAMLVRRDAALAVGAFEESYFMYFEEVDLCYRLSKAGWATHFVPNATVMHLGGGSTSQVRTAMLIQRFRSTIGYYERHTTGATRLFWTTLVRLRWSARLVRDSAKLLMTVDRERRQSLRAEVAAWWSAVTGRPHAGHDRPRRKNGNGSVPAPGDE